MFTGETMTDYNSDIDPVAPNNPDRDTAECPVCSNTVRQTRDKQRWICGGCAREWKDNEFQP